MHFHTFRHARGVARTAFVLTALAFAAVTHPAAAQQPTTEQLQAQIEELRAEVAALEATQGVSPEKIEELERRIAALADELEALELGEARAEADQTERGMGPAASKIYRTDRGLSIGGYGEVLYESFDSSRDDGTPSGATDEVDALRAIVYIGYKFNDRFLFNSEIEFEHAGARGGEGEAVMEFAYLDYLGSPGLNVRAGLLLIPMGLINELHEPTIFLSAQRPVVEQRVLPTTWRENGFGLYGDLGPLTYRTYLVNGFDAAGFSAGGLRGGRQKGGEAKAEDIAWVGRLDWSVTPSLTLGASAYVGDSGQDLTTLGGRSVDAGLSIVDVHADWRYRGLQARGLWAQADVDDVALLNEALELTGADSVGERLEGGYLELGYDLFSLWPRGEQSLVPFVRFETVDTQAEVPTGFTADPANDAEYTTIGLSWKPIPQVVFKVDHRNGENAAGTGLDQINLALGYVF